MAMTRVLFLCTGNCCRSQMAEGLLRHIDPERFAAFSAGFAPAGFIIDLAGAALEALGVRMYGQHSKGWDNFADREMDVVITLCDDAASEPCPVWPGAPLKSHWSTPDPSFHPGSDEERMSYAVMIARRLQAKIERMTTLDFENTPRDKLQQELDHIAAM